MNSLVVVDLLWGSCHVPQNAFLVLKRHACVVNIFPQTVTETASLVNDDRSKLINGSTVDIARSSLGLILICSFVVSGYRSNNFIVGLTDVSPAITALTLWNYDLCARYPGVVGEGATVNLTCTSCVPPRRYLIVQIEATIEALNFCEIEVYVGGK